MEKIKKRFKTSIEIRRLAFKKGGNMEKNLTELGELLHNLALSMMPLPKSKKISHFEILTELMLDH